MEIRTLNKSEPIFDYGSLQLRGAEAAVLGAVLLEPESATKLFRELNKQCPSKTVAQKGGAFYGSN